MKIKISKAHGTKNTFIIIYDNNNHKLIKPKIQRICREFDTDGFLLVSDYENYDYNYKKIMIVIICN